MADDGLPMAQAYYYDGDYINIFTQEIIDACMTNIPSESVSSSQEASETEASSSESNWAEEVEEEEAKAAGTSEVAPNSAETNSVVQQYYPTEYYCQESGTYYQTENCQPLLQQPTIAYVYQDENGLNQVYYVAGPYMVPQTETA